MAPMAVAALVAVVAALCQAVAAVMVVVVVPVVAVLVPQVVALWVGRPAPMFVLLKQQVAAVAHFLVPELVVLEHALVVAEPEPALVVAELEPALVVVVAVVAVIRP